MKTHLHIVGFLLITLTGYCQQNQFGSASTSSLDKYLARKAKKMGLIGMQAGFVTDTYIYQGNFGVKQYATEHQVDEGTLFMIASCSKPVTALGIMKLQEEGRLQLDDPASNYLPFRVANPNFPDEVITLRMLLTHVSSIKDNWDILTPLYTIEEGGDSPLPLIEFLRGYLLKGGMLYDGEENFWKEKPATLFEYCNVGYALLGLVIEQVSGLPFNEFMNRKIFSPLGMTESFWFLAEIPHSNIARPHEMPNKQTTYKVPQVLKHYGYPDFPDGQIRTTTSDYGRFIQLFLTNGKINDEQFLTEASIDEFLKVQYPEKFKYQAIAWNYNEFDNWVYYLLMPRLPSHTGADPGVATVVSFDREKKIGAMIFTNSPTNTFINQKRFYQETIKRLLKEARKHQKRSSNSD